jgi:uncharacterized damage-inducible protein DinB
MTLHDAILESWDRNVRTLSGLAELITADQLGFKLAEGEMDIAEQLCHVHGTRRGWIFSLEPERLAGFERLHVQNGDDWKAIRDLEIIRLRLAESAKLVRDLTWDLLEKGVERQGPYEHPIFFMQHMVWHEGWHVGAIMTILRLNGVEPSEQWEDANLWGQWRDPEF